MQWYQRLSDAIQESSYQYFSPQSSPGIDEANHVFSCLSPAEETETIPKALKYPAPLPFWPDWAKLGFVQDSMDCSLSGSPVHGISQARILEWVTISYSRGSSWPRDQTRVPCISWQGDSLPSVPSGESIMMIVNRTPYADWLKPGSPPWIHV